MSSGPRRQFSGKGTTRMFVQVRRERRADCSSAQACGCIYYTVHICDSIHRHPVYVANLKSSLLFPSSFVVLRYSLFSSSLIAFHRLSLFSFVHL